MKFSLYRRGAVVAYAFDDHGTVGLRHLDGLGLLRVNGIRTKAENDFSEQVNAYDGNPHVFYERR